ncbi:hypothetical protein BDR03DRAFT_982978 [Suillus americanus]|nr:hypothetical protein BDR03DRAFT_982978 [Suillus americanus]
MAQALKDACLKFYYSNSKKALKNTDKFCCTIPINVMLLVAAVLKGVISGFQETGTDKVPDLTTEQCRTHFINLQKSVDTLLNIPERREELEDMLEQWARIGMGGFDNLCEPCEAICHVYHVKPVIKCILGTEYVTVKGRLPCVPPSLLMNGKAKTKEVKSMKVKELIFQISEPNYIEFLTTILVKHNKSHYRVTERKKYSFKYLLGNSHGHAKVMDVDNQADYVEMAKKLIFKEPQKVKIFNDMKNVEKLPVSTTRNEIVGDTASQDSKASDDDEIAVVDGTTELDHEIACFHRLIIKKWGNEYDNSVTYMHQSGMEIPCTPAIIKDWACAMYEIQTIKYDREATTMVLSLPQVSDMSVKTTLIYSPFVSLKLRVAGTLWIQHMVPPNIPSFDPAKHEPTLHPMCHSMAASVATPAATSVSTTDINSLISMLLLQTV